MNLPLLQASFVEILKNEWLGIVASVFILVSFLTSNQIKTRIINCIGCVVFVVYGILLPAYSTAFMNAAMLVVHIVFITKHFVKRRKEKAVPAKSATAENTSDAKDATPETETQAAEIAAADSSEDAPDRPE